MKKQIYEVTSILCEIEAIMLFVVAIVCCNYWLALFSAMFTVAHVIFRQKIVDVELEELLATRNMLERIKVTFKEDED